MIRLAAYYTPDSESPLAAVAAEWLGRSIFSSDQIPHTPPGLLSLQRYHEIIAEPFYYGFHGTIKPPFYLKDGTTIEQIINTMHRLSRRLQKFTLAPLAVTSLADFFCLQPTVPCAKLSYLAEETVKALDEFRRPPDAIELKKRYSATLTSRQKQLLQTWGYPYLMEEFRFHLTLTGKIGDARERKIVEEELKKRFEPYLQDVPFCSLALFIEEDKKPLRLLQLFPLAKSVRIAKT
jgi:hypothetical protein